MKISKERLLLEADSTGFRPEVLEKVILLLNLLPLLFEHTFLKPRLVLKGGTALNLFCFDVQRLSVDIDLNYIGAVDLEVMKAERPDVESAIRAVCEREGLRIDRVPQDHAGGKWKLSYDSPVGAKGKLQIDLNYMHRLPLWPIDTKTSALLGSFRATGIPILNIHELAAGKLAALMSRASSRDLFDSHLLLTQGELDPEKLRLAFVVNGAMNRKDWRTISIDNLNFSHKELKNELLPMLRKDLLDDNDDTKTWAERLIEETYRALSIVLPLSEVELQFLNRILDEGEIEAHLLTDDLELIERISNHPQLRWKARNVKEYKGR